MYATDDRVGLEHEIASRRRREKCGVVGQPKRAGMGRERLKETRDQAILGRDVVGAAIVLPGRAAEFGRAQTPREMVEHGIDHAGLVALDKSGGNVSIFGNHDTRWHIVADAISS